MPVWHKATKALHDESKVMMAGIVEEQHGERARLFMQWKEMDWPVMVDSFNLLDVPYVPITLLIDEHGVIREIVSPRADPLNTVEAFLEKTYPPPEAAVKDATEDPDDDMAQFRLGVEFRMRFDSKEGTPDDFRKAVEHWEKALSLDPDNYIHRRRIEQYGPRLDKPYPFYDWIDEARRDITERGEEPVALTVEPRGAELTGPVKRFMVSNTQKPPALNINITRDDGMVKIETAVVPSHVKPGGSARVHVFFRPAEGVHWNNEAGNLVMWVSAPEGWSLSNPHLIHPVPTDRAVSREHRTVEFEVLASDQGAELEAYALYYVCKEESGACLFRRQDLKIPILVRK